MSDDLKRLRDAIDRVDDGILEALNQRAKLAPISAVTSSGADSSLAAYPAKMISRASGLTGNTSVVTRP